MTSKDRIERSVTLRAPISRVWQALTDAREFGSWFGFALEGQFVAGQTIRGRFDGTIDEQAIIDFQKSQGLTPAGLKIPDVSTVFCTVESMEPERYFSFRWIPYAIDAEANPDDEPTTLVEFRLEPVSEGTLLHIVESGFDRVPVHRRARAFRMNEGGWTSQLENLGKYVETR
jgi:uncharacterized protein YndB with AHSA1/START domain